METQQSKTAFSIIKMSKPEGQNKPIGHHGVIPEVNPGVEVRYFANAAIRGLGYRLTATEIVAGEKKAKTRPHTNIAAIAQVITDLSNQKKRLDNQLRRKISEKLDSQKSSGHPDIRVMLFFKESNDDPTTLIARYGFGIDGRSGLVIFGNEGVTAGHNFVNIFFHPNKNYGRAIAVTNDGLVNKVINDLNHQIQLAEDYFNPQIADIDESSGECKKLLKQAIRQRDGQVA